jgi:hypothetical protein
VPVEVGADTQDDLGHPLTPAHEPTHRCLFSSTGGTEQPRGCYIWIPQEAVTRLPGLAHNQWNTGTHLHVIFR